MKGNGPGRAEMRIGLDEVEHGVSRRRRVGGVRRGVLVSHKLGESISPVVGRTLGV